MSGETHLEDFAVRLKNEVNDNSESDVGDFRVNEFTRIFGSLLFEAGEIDDDPVIFYFKTKGMLANGYSVGEGEDSIDLFVTIFTQEVPTKFLSKDIVSGALKSAQAVLKSGLEGQFRGLEEASPAYDMFQRIFELKESLKKARIFLLTDGRIKAEKFEKQKIGAVAVSYYVWDVEKAYQFEMSGKKSDPIEIDFENEFGSALPCLSVADSKSDYQGYLLVIPGAVLAQIYEKYGAKLLERNVRSFLQARGGVNKGIRNTILESPHRFFAYNNGISATAESVELRNGSNGISLISKIKNLQIVNGGQTTASMWSTAKKDKANLEGISVQAKLSVIPLDHLDEVVPLISRYANSQNKVSDADFYANDPFHVELEGFSRKIWTSISGSERRSTQWFYERARGQYLDALAHEGTPSKKKNFQDSHPKAQMFTKTDLAKFENTWRQAPYLVSLGAQKNFNLFSIRLKEREKVQVDQKFYEDLIAKAILFKRAEKIVASLELGGYRANIVTYTLALLSHRTSKRINLSRIWKEQELTFALGESIRDVAAQVHKLIVKPPDGKNVTEWCKKKDCWELVRDSQISIGKSLEDELLDESESDSSVGEVVSESDAFKKQALIEEVSKISSEIWFSLAKWAKATKSLDTWKIRHASQIGKAIENKAHISPKKAEQAKSILNEAKSAGFRR